MKNKRIACLMFIAVAFGLVGCQPPSNAATSCDCVHKIANVSYGPAGLEVMDVYIPSNVGTHAPIIFMVHGGAWQEGDKSHPDVVDNKIAYFLPRGFIFISIDYRLVPTVDVMTEASNVASALAYVQQNAASWGGDPTKIVLMGHSAGAHLIALITTATSIQQAAGLQPWLGNVELDSAAYDVVSIMQQPHPPLYDPVFGTNKTLWVTASPFYRMTAKIPPMLEVCTPERNGSCPQANEFNNAALSFGSDSSVFSIALTHEEIDADVGLPNLLTSRIQSFLCSKFRLDCGH